MSKDLIPLLMWLETRLGEWRICSTFLKEWRTIMDTLKIQKFMVKVGDYQLRNPISILALFNSSRLQRSLAIKYEIQTQMDQSQTVISSFIIHTLWIPKFQTVPNFRIRTNGFLLKEWAALVCVRWILEGYHWHARITYCSDVRNRDEGKLIPKRKLNSTFP